MNDQLFWEKWAGNHSGLDAVIIGDKSVVKYRNWVENKVFNSIKLNKKARILEIGCGNGRWIKRLETKGFKDITGIDFSENLIKEAKKNTEAKLYVMDSTKLGFKDESFDIVFIFLVLSHTDFNMFKKTLEEAARVINKNGKLIIMDEPYTLGAVWDMKDMVKILKNKGLQLSKVRAIRTEWVTRILGREPNVSKIKKERLNLKSTFNVKGIIKVLLEFPIDLICITLNCYNFAFERLMIFEKK